MCSVCAGSVCAGTGGCAVVINHAPEVMKITYSSTSNLFSTLQSVFASVFASSKNLLWTLLRK